MHKILIVGLLAVYSCFSQNEKNTTHFGFKAGINNSRVLGEELDGTLTGYVGIELYASFLQIRA